MVLSGFQKGYFLKSDDFQNLVRIIARREPYLPRVSIKGFRAQNVSGRFRGEYLKPETLFKPEPFI